MSTFVTSGHVQQPPARYTVGDVARILGCHADTVRVYIHSGALPALNLGTGTANYYRISPTDLAAFVAARTTKAAS